MSSQQLLLSMLSSIELSAEQLMEVSRVLCVSLSVPVPSELAVTAHSKEQSKIAKEQSKFAKEQSKEQSKFAKEQAKDKSKEQSKVDKEHAIELSKLAKEHAKEQAKVEIYKESVHKISRMKMQISFHAALKRLFRAWLVVHVVVAVFMVALISAHVAVTTYLGFHWIFTAGGT